jgi:excinuclease ABC subunit A
MLKSSARSVIRLRGVRQNNLKNFDLDLPFNQLIVVTGLSGSGKSSLAFDTLFAEGQRRYIETFSPYARQFLDRMDKPQVDSIEGIPPAIAIEQRNAVKTTRSTVGTMTEICEYLKMLWPHISQLHCRQCGRTVRKDSPQSIWALVTSGPQPCGSEYLITFDLPVSEKLSLAETLGLVRRQGYQRLLTDGRVVRLEEAGGLGKARLPGLLTVVQDRIQASESNRPRFTEACEQAYHFGKGKLSLWRMRADRAEPPRRFSNRLHCAECDVEYRPPSPALFSFNHPVGACPKCRGFGRVISIDYQLAIPDASRTLAQGLVKPWQTGLGAECQADLMRMCRHAGIPTNVPFEKLPKKWRDLVVDGDPDYGKDEEHEWPRAWYGVKGYFRWLESKAYKMHVRVLLSRYRAYTPCPDCNGTRFQADTLLYRCPAGTLAAELPNEKTSLTLADFYQLPIRDALRFIDEARARHNLRPNEGPGITLNEVRSRLGYLDEVGLGYLTLDRPTRSLSGGETERVNLTTCLGTRLVNTLYVLDEPSVGLHPRDTDRLIQVLKRLRDSGNTVVVVEHEASVMRAANQILDLGPGHGATGGEVVFQGSYENVLLAERSLTGQYLSGRKTVEIPGHRPVALPEFSSGSQPSTPGKALALNDAAALYAESSRLRSADWQPGVSPNCIRQASASSHKNTPANRPHAGQGQSLSISNATRHNLKHVTVEIPLDRLVCVTGVSGSGKTTLVREVLLPLLNERLRAQMPGSKASDRLADVTPRPDDQNGDPEEDDDSHKPGRTEAAEATLEGFQHLDRVVLVDQSLLGKTPRSNPAVYIGAFDDIRDVFAASETAQKRGLNASAFSFNSSQGQCERCRGAGYEKIEMQFLSDIFIRCPDCDGRRYRPHILEVKIGGTYPARSKRPAPENKPNAGPNGTGPGPWSIADLLNATVDEGVEFLVGFAASKAAARAMAALDLLQQVGLGYLKLGQPINTLSGGESQRLKLVRHLAETLATDDRRNKDLRTLFLFDEPTTGLHFEDVSVLMKVFQRLVDAGHSVVVIEHNLDVVKSADWIIDLGPEAGDQGGYLVAQGTPEFIETCETSHTGRALRQSFCRPGLSAGSYTGANAGHSHRGAGTRKGRTRS